MAAGQGLAVATIAQTILDAIVAHFAAAAGVTLPDRRVIAPGNPRLVSWDCSQLVVTMAGIGVGQAPGLGGTPNRVGNPVSAAGMRHATFAAQLVRCVPESRDGTTPPDAAALTTAGLALLRDAGLMSQALTETATTVASKLGPGGLVVPGAVEVLGPEGGFAAVEGSLVVTAGMLA